MKASRVAWLASAVAGLSALTLGAAYADAVQVVSPSAAMDVEGNRSVQAAVATYRVQYLYPASDFAGLPESERWLVGLGIRGDRLQTTAVDWTFPNERIWMSTTSKTALTNVFDDNHGADKTLVHDGEVVIHIPNSGPAGGPHDFADGAPFGTPFYYDPSQGNLLVERQVFQPSSPSPSPFVDVQAMPDAHVLVGSVTATRSDILLNELPVARFEFVPEPSGWVLAGGALVGLLAVWRNRVAASQQNPAPPLPSAVERVGRVYRWSD
jgi:hypothetical protein